MDACNARLWRLFCFTGGFMAQYDGSIRIGTEITTKQAERELKSLESSITKTADKIASLRSKMDALKDVKISTKEYSALTSELNKQIEKLKEWNAYKQETSEKGLLNENHLKSINNRIIETEQKIKNIANEMNRLDSAGKAFTLGSDTEEYVQMATQVQQLNQQMQSDTERQAELQSALTAEEQRLAQIRENAVVGNQHIIEVIERRKQLLQEIKDLEKAGVTQGYEDYDSRQQELAALNQEIRDYSRRTEQARESFKKLGNMAKKVASSIAAAFSSVAKKSILAMTSAVKRATSAMFGFGKSTKKSNNMLQSGFKTILKYGLGIRSFYILVNKFRNAVKEGFKNLAQYSSPVNDSLSMLKSSLTQLKNSLATAFAPILTAAAPALTALINMISRAATYVGMLIAALTGQKTFTKAVAVQEDYAASLNDSAKSAKKAEKATKTYLSGLDEVRQFETDKSSENGDGNDGKYTVPSPSEMFETVPIESSIKGIVEKIRELIQAEDWEGLGAYIAEGLNHGIEKIRQAISWDNVGPQVTYFVNAFTTTLNSLVDNLDWDLIGRTIGEGINTLVNTLNLLITGIDWVNLGSKFAEGVNGLFDEVNWENLGELLGNKFMIAWNFFSGLVSNLNYASIGKSIGDGINGIFNAINFTTIANTLSTGLNGLAKLIQEFSIRVDWDGIAENTTNGLNTFIHNVKWEYIGESLGNLFSDLLHTLNVIIAETDWLELGAGLMQSLNGVIKGINWSELGELLGNTFKGILNFLIGAVQEIDWELLGDSIANFLSGIDWGGVVEKVFELLGAAFGKLVELGAYIGGAIADAFSGIGKYFDKKIEECGGNVVLGIFKGIGDAIAGIGKWIYDHIFKPFIDGFKNVFGIHSPSKVMSEQGGFIISGLLDGLKNSISSVLNWLKNIPGWFGEKFKAAYELAKNAFSGIGNFFGNVWEGIKKPFGNIAGWFKDKFSAAWKAVKDVFSAGGKIFDGIKDGILNGLKAIINALIDGINSVIAIPFNGINWALESIRDVNILGFTPFDWISTIDIPQIPKLATGAVIPANKEFLAVLGDQKHGTNIETPEALMRKAFREELRNELKGIQMQGSGVTYNFNAYINRRALFEELITEAKLRQTVSGRNPFELA